jgi:hypothetical protein
MTQPPDLPDSFADPQLKAAVVRVHNGHRIHPDLRERILRRLSDEGLLESAVGELGSSKPPPQNLQLFRSPAWMALAACLLLLIGGGGAYLWHLRHEAQERTEYMAANRGILDSMVQVHNGGCTVVVSAPASIADDAATISKKLSDALGRYVPVARFNGWKLDTVDVCDVGTNRARVAHWTFTRNGRRMTVFSFPASVFKIDEEYDHYDYVINGHAVAGFLRNGGVHCLVVDPELSAEDSVALRDELKRG